MRSLHKYNVLPLLHVFTKREHFPTHFIKLSNFCLRYVISVYMHIDRTDVDRNDDRTSFQILCKHFWGYKNYN